MTARLLSTDLDCGMVYVVVMYGTMVWCGGHVFFRAQFSFLVDGGVGVVVVPMQRWRGAACCYREDWTVKKKTAHPQLVDERHNFSDISFKKH